MLVAPLTLLCLTLSVSSGNTFAGRYLPMDNRGMGRGYRDRDGPVITDKDANWDRMDLVKVILG